MPESGDSTTPRRSSFVESLSAFSRQHRAQHWEGTFGDFLTRILPSSPASLTRSSHQYIWDMLSEVAQRRLRDDFVPEGYGHTAFPLPDIEVGITAEQVKEAIRPELAAQSDKLSEQLLGEYNLNNGAVDFYLATGEDDELYLFFVDAEDPLPAAYGYTKPGFFADVKVVVETRDSVVVPASAVLPSDRGFIAWVVGPDGAAEERRVEIGLRTREGEVEVLEGLAAGESLVVKGGAALRPGAAVKVVAAVGAGAAGGAEAVAGGGR